MHQALDLTRAGFLTLKSGKVDIEEVDGEIAEIISTLKRLSKKFKIKPEEMTHTLVLRELVLLNQQLHAVHEHLDWLTTGKKRVS